MTRVKFKIAEQHAGCLLDPRQVLTMNQAQQRWGPKQPKKVYLREHIGRVSLASRLTAVPADQRVRVVYRFGFLKRRKRDMENWAPTSKAITDGLVKAGILWADDSSAVEGPYLIDDGLTTDRRPLPFTCITLSVTITPVEPWVRP